MKLLCFGGREYGMTVDTSARHPVLRVKPEQIKRLFETLDDYKSEHNGLLSDGTCLFPDTLSKVIVGCAPGADFLCAVWACSRGIPVEEWPADWKKLGPAAGPIRNTNMISLGDPDEAIGFPGGVGSDDTRRKLAMVKVPTILVEGPE